MRVAIYARVSTTEQSCDMQLDGMREYCRSRNLQIAKEYVDNGVSGAKSDRPALNRLMADARARRFDALLVWKLDRFARSLRHLVLALDELQELGIAFISCSDAIDLSTPAGRLMFQLIGAMAEFERALIVERVRAGVKRAIASGRPWGRHPIPIDPTKIPAGVSLRQAAKLLGVNRESLRRALKRP